MERNDNLQGVCEFSAIQSDTKPNVSGQATGVGQQERRGLDGNQHIAGKPECVIPR
jgi:hypothetical protein